MAVGSVLARLAAAVVLVASLTGPLTGRAGAAVRTQAAPLGPSPGAAPAQGYLTAGADGGVFGYDTSSYYGSEAGRHLNQPVVGMAATPDGHGYWLVAADGGIFAFGDAPFYGSEGGRHLNQPVVDMTATAAGYRLVAADGGVFDFGQLPFAGSVPGRSQAVSDVVGIASTADGAGYWIATADGTVYDFGDARFLGDHVTEVIDRSSTGALQRPWVSIVANPAAGDRDASYLYAASYGDPDCGSSSGATCPSGAPNITVYGPPSATGSGSGGVPTPVATISGPATDLGAPVAVAVDPSGRLFVANRTYVAEYAPGATRDVAPVAVIRGPHGGFTNLGDISVDTNGDLYVQEYPDILEFGPGAEGDDAPLRTLDDPDLEAGAGVLADPDGSVFALINPVMESGTPTVLHFSATAAGSDGPESRITGASGINAGTLALDPAGDVAVTNFDLHTIAVFPPTADGAATPTATIDDPQLEQPGGLAIDGAGDDFVVSSYPATAPADTGTEITELGPDGTVGPSFDGGSYGPTALATGGGDYA